MSVRLKLYLLIGALLGIAVLFIGYEMGHNISYIVRSRSIRLASILIVGISVAFASIMFQTITNNRILTPSIMGYESVFILFQTVIVFVYGDKSFAAITQEQNFLYAMLLMMAFSILMYFVLFGKQKKNIFQLLLLGMILGTLFSAISNFMQVLLDPNRFSIVQNYMFASFSNLNTNLLGIAAVTLVLCILLTLPYLKYLDVLALGREHAINLGLNYQKIVRRIMLIISLLVSVSTALVGPITFLGILVANLTYELFTTRRHVRMVWLCSLISCLLIVGAQFLVEHVFSFTTTVSIVINFVGGIYFMYVILKRGTTV